MVESTSVEDCAELREIAGLAAAACDAALAAVVPRGGAACHVAGRGLRAAELPPGPISTLQLASVTAPLHVVARVPVVDARGVCLATLAAYDLAARSVAGAQQAMLAGLARLAARALARPQAPVTPPFAAAPEVRRAIRLLARAAVRDGRRTTTRLRDEVASATSGTSLLLAALAERLPALGARVTADVHVARTALDAATLACRQLAASQPAFVASGYSLDGALALYVAHATRSRWPACTIDVAHDAPRELAPESTLLLLGIVAQAAAIAQRRPECRHFALRVAPLVRGGVRVLVAADGRPVAYGARCARRLLLARQLAAAARADLLAFDPGAGEGCVQGERTPADVQAALAALRDTARVPELEPVLAVAMPGRRRSGRSGPA